MNSSSQLNPHEARPQPSRSPATTQRGRPPMSSRSSAASRRASTACTSATTRTCSTRRGWAITPPTAMACCTLWGPRRVILVPLHGTARLRPAGSAPSAGPSSSRLLASSTSTRAWSRRRVMTVVGGGPRLLLLPPLEHVGGRGHGPDELSAGPASSRRNAARAQAQPPNPTNSDLFGLAGAWHGAGAPQLHAGRPVCDSLVILESWRLEYLDKAFRPATPPILLALAGSDP